ncbi:hypothetical protein GAPWK_1779 [Gilliamella apicola]|nr:hypothetical protein GAPWK_1779 [Gilliamella apicola]
MHCVAFILLAKKSLNAIYNLMNTFNIVFQQKQSLLFH